jgi:hypothetical protein
MLGVTLGKEMTGGCAIKIVLSLHEKGDGKAAARFAASDRKDINAVRSDASAYP